jgi:sporulation protein YlmC with PRC-barrel domain
MHYSLVLDLLDNQLVDSDGLPVGRVDDVVLEARNERPHVTGLVVGSSALGSRLGGAVGRVVTGVSERLRDRARPPGSPVIDTGAVDRLRPEVKLRMTMAELPDLAPLERWLSGNVVRALPGTDHAGE